jgi:hypothetical protein
MSTQMAWQLWAAEQLASAGITAPLPLLVQAAQWWRFIRTAAVFVGVCLGLYAVNALGEGIVWLLRRPALAAVVVAAASHNLIA